MGSGWNYYLLCRSKGCKRLHKPDQVGACCIDHQYDSCSAYYTDTRRNGMSDRISRDPDSDGKCERRCNSNLVHCRVCRIIGWLSDFIQSRYCNLLGTGCSWNLFKPDSTDNICCIDHQSCSSCSYTGSGPYGLRRKRIPSIDGYRLSCGVFNHCLV